MDKRRRFGLGYQDIIFFITIARHSLHVQEVWRKGLKCPRCLAREYNVGQKEISSDPGRKEIALFGQKDHMMTDGNSCDIVRYMLL